ncbi:MAG: hypothetical protein AB7L13_13045 [Acidimicrobiia bacterium]
MNSEIEMLRDALTDRGIAAHGHDAEHRSCASGSVCIIEEDQVTALVVSPDHRKVHVDPMTAYGIVVALDRDADFEKLWAELVDIDHGD